MKTSPDPSGAIRAIVDILYGHHLDSTERQALADAIAPFVTRTHRSFEEAVHTIAANYVQDGARVQRLRHAHATEWQTLLTQVMAISSKNARHLPGGDIFGSPDLDAYEDIQRGLESYNYEAPFDNWIKAVVNQRLRRFRRDRNALKAGGSGFRKQPKTDDEEHSYRMAGPFHYSLDDRAGGIPLCETLVGNHPSVQEHVEDAALEHVVAETVSAFAAYEQDPSLVQIWSVIVDQDLKLREAADRFGLSILQVHRRVARTRAYLRNDVRVRQWFDLPVG